MGYSLPPLRAATLSISCGDTLIFATDGVSGKFLQGQLANGSVQDLACDLLHRYAKPTDDALVMVARYVGSRP